MATRDDEVFKGVVNDPESREPYPNNSPTTRGGRPRKERTFSRSYPVEIKGNGYGQFLGKRIGDTVDGLFVSIKGSDDNLAGYTLVITGGSDKTGTPMRPDLDGGSRKSVLTTPTVGYKGKKRRRFKNKTNRNSKHGNQLVRVSTPHGMRQRRVFRGNTITADIVQVNLKVVEHGNKPLSSLFANGQSSGSDADTSSEGED